MAHQLFPSPPVRKRAMHEGYSCEEKNLELQHPQGFVVTLNNVRTFNWLEYILKNHFSLEGQKKYTRKKSFFFIPDDLRKLLFLKQLAKTS